MEKLIEKILKEENSVTDDYLSENEKQEYLEIIGKIKQQCLYQSKIHGLYHSKKVCLFAFIIGKKLKLNKEEMQIIIDAALYHDIGRQNDTNDSLHGFASAYRIESAVDSEIYKDPKNLNMLKAIIDSHSVNDEKSECSFKYYFECFDNLDLEKNPLYSKIYRTFIKLNSILKDADGLDRNRFVDGYCFGLDERFLRLNESKKLIQLSREINDFYTDNYVKEVNLDEVKGCYNDCMHGIGYDFFKLRSILENGILSASTLRDKKIDGVKNFNGGNARNWVSVVDASLIGNGYTGYETFIKNGIGFMCENQFLVEPLTYRERSKAMEKGLPYNKSNHNDERYVYKEIIPEDIKKIVLNNESCNKKIDSIVFLFNCLDYRTFLSRVGHYIDETKAKQLGYDKVSLNAYLLEYKLIIDRYNDLKFANIHCNGQKLILDLNCVLEKINIIIRDMIKKYYSSELKITGEEITVKDIVSYELSKMGGEYISIIEEDQVVFMPKEKTKTLISNRA